MRISDKPELDMFYLKKIVWSSYEENYKKQSLDSYSSPNIRWFKYDRDWFVCKQAALRSSCETLREWNHNLHPPSCSG